jgi:uncharacterized protein YbdZ (MbtH family)
MTNPSDDPDGIHHVVVNDECQHALLALVHRGPHGLDGRTRRELAPGGPPRALTDMRPRSLVREMEIAGNGVRAPSL